MSKDPYRILKRPIITEKSTVAKDDFNKVSFRVDLTATKHEIKSAVEEIFRVTVLEVRTMRLKGKAKRFGRSFGRRPDWKKAVITLKEGDKIEFFEGA